MDGSDFITIKNVWLSYEIKLWPTRKQGKLVHVSIQAKNCPIHKPHEHLFHWDANSTRLWLQLSKIMVAQVGDLACDISILQGTGVGLSRK